MQRQQCDGWLAVTSGRVAVFIGIILYYNIIRQRRKRLCRLSGPRLCCSSANLKIYEKIKTHYTQICIYIYLLHAHIVDTYRYYDMLASYNQSKTVVVPVAVIRLMGTILTAIKKKYIQHIKFKCFDYIEVFMYMSSVLHLVYDFSPH